MGTSHKANCQEQLHTYSPLPNLFNITLRTLLAEWGQVQGALIFLNTPEHMTTAAVTIYLIP